MSGGGERRRRSDDDGWVTVKIQKRTRNRLAQLATDVARRGWAAFGASRSDMPTTGAVLDEAVRALEGRGGAGGAGNAGGAVRS